MADLTVVLRDTANLVREMDAKHETKSEPLVKLFLDAAECIESFRKLDEKSKLLIETQQEQIDAYKELVEEMKARHDH